ncbi:MAG TPA: hypothetical protein PKN50_13060 [Spirochaetota bacterium]|nr:hypothetical protein [Spirochaetota bacterium]HPV43645.1 hypothetical protein [Spirochaetota bacterium]
MKYFGKKSLSSFLSSFLRVAWYIVLVFSIIAAVFGTGMILVSSSDHVMTELAKCNMTIPDMEANDKDWETFRNLPLGIKFFLMPYMAAVVVLLLKIITRAQQLFANFKNDIVFSKTNVLLISRMSRLMIVFSIVTFSFYSLLVSIILLMLCEIFKSGTALQEEHDLTV